MLFLTPAWNKSKPLPERLGIMLSPNNDSGITALVRAGRPWAADNACFRGKCTPERFIAWLEHWRDHAGTCLFAVCPDALTDAEETMARFAQYAPAVRTAGFPVAFVTQDGQGADFPACDALFIGGSTAWKLGPGARECIEEAHRRSIWIHAGRVNSAIRFAYFRDLGCRSADGSTLCFGRDRNIREVMTWISSVGLWPSAGCISPRSSSPT